MKTRFFIIMPLYNKEASVSRAIKSVIRQTYVDFTLLVINDGSTDNSKDVASSFLGDIRIRLVDKPNGGAASARNLGLAYCDEEYAVFLDADDEWFPEFLEYMAQLIRVFPEATLYSCGYLNCRNGQIYEGCLLPTSDRSDDFIVTDYFRKISSLKKSINNSSNTVVRVSGIGKGINFDENMRFYEDHSFWYRLMLRGELAYNSKSLVVVHKDSENRSADEWDSCVALKDLSRLVVLVLAEIERGGVSKRVVIHFRDLVKARAGYLFRIIIRSADHDAFLKGLEFGMGSRVFKFAKSNLIFLLYTYLLSAISYIQKRS